MTGNDEGLAPVVGGPARHVPVLLADAVGALNLTAGGTYLDGTFGAGGYARAILGANPDIRLLALDRDPTAIAGGAALVTEAKGRLVLSETTFGQLDEEATRLGFAPLDGIVLDIGVSSMQIDEAERGFSFRFDGPLDMRMAAHGTSAADLVNEADEATLANILYYFGEERRSRAVARAIIEARRIEPITTTKRLAQIVATIVWAEPGGANPATRTFQALRIAVNDELGELVRALHAAERILKPGGRLAVVTFHSLEDRIVKQFLSERSGRTPAGSRHAPATLRPNATFSLVSKGPIKPSSRELAENSRARSAKLRCAERTAEPAREMDPDLAALAELPAAKPRRRG